MYENTKHTSGYRMAAKFSFGKVFLLAGAFVAFLIGSGFSTGQEVLQYFASYGYKGLFGSVIVFILLSYAAATFLCVGYQEQFTHGQEVYTYFCGKYIGKFYDYFALVVIYASYIVMIAGFAATVKQHYGVSNYIGGIALALCSAFTVCLGLKNIINILGKVGPIIIFFLLILALSSFLKGNLSIHEASELIPDMGIIQTGYNWFIASVSYVGMCMLWLAVFLTELGKNTNFKSEALYGGMLGALLFSLAILLLTLSLLSNIELVAYTMIPTLLLAKIFHSFLGTFFSLLILIGIYTASVPLLWTTCSRFCCEGSRKFIALTCILAVVGVWIGLLVPFNELVNNVYAINGYVGTGLLAFMMHKTIYLKLKKRFIK